MEGEPKEIRVTMTYDRTMKWERFWSWVDLTIQQINNGRHQRMIDLGHLTYEPITREDFQKLVVDGKMILEDDLGAFGKLSTIFTYEVLEEEDDERTGSDKFSGPPTIVS